MKIPKSVTIKGSKYKIKMGKSLTVAGDPCMGFVDKSKREIYLDSTMSIEDLETTLLHEIVHAIFNEIGLHHTSLTNDLEELVSDNISTAFCKMFTLKWKTTT